MTILLVHRRAVFVERIVEIIDIMKLINLGENV